MLSFITWPNPSVYPGDDAIEHTIETKTPAGEIICPSGWIFPSRHAIFREYSLSVPPAWQRFGHPRSIYGTC